MTRPSPVDSRSALDPSRPPRWASLRAREQVALAGLLGLVLLGHAGWWAVTAAQGHGPVMVDIPSVPPPRFSVELNEAAWPEWMLLPGIGEKRARAIVALRSARDGFREVDELDDVPGIGPKTLEKLRDYVVDSRSPRDPQSKSPGTSPLPRSSDPPP